MRTWKEICEDRTLQDLPCKIEANRFNQIVMSPASNWRGGFQSEIARKLPDALPGGRLITECAVETSDGVKVPDVAWVSTDRLQPHRRSASMPIAPEICVEIRSYSNSVVEMMGKMQLYSTNSKLCPNFPAKFDW